ncbi:MAG TPA: hypothetical protein VLM89_16295 [Phycisphaerae bacterium]|nr:hypothetical protein [Phycisphaerae bacterium]
MPVHLRDDECIPTTRPARDRDDRSDLMAATFFCLISALICLVPAAILLVLALRHMAPALAAADKLTSEGVEERAAFGPIILFAILGGAFGAVLGWRISSSISLANSFGKIVAGATVLLLVIVGWLALSHLFPSGVPAIAWAGLTTLAVGSFIGLYLINLWTH